MNFGTKNTALKIETIIAALRRSVSLACLLLVLIPSAHAGGVSFRLQFVGSELLGYYGDNLRELQRMDTLLKYAGRGGVTGIDSVVMESGYLEGDVGEYLQKGMCDRRLTSMREYLERRVEYYGYAPLSIVERPVCYPSTDADPRIVTQVNITMYLNGSSQQSVDRLPTGRGREQRIETPELPYRKPIRQSHTAPGFSGRHTERTESVVAFKTDLVLWGGVTPGFDLTAVTPNLAVEAYLGRRWSVEFSMLYTHWNDFRKENFQALDAYRIEPRFWFGNDRLFRGFYIGITAGYGSFDHRPARIEPADNSGYTGTFLTTGVTLGYAQALSPHWFLELGITGGYRTEKYKSYRIEQGYNYYERDISRNRMIPGVRLNLTYRICRRSRTM